MKTQILEIELRDRKGNICLTTAEDKAWTSNFHGTIQDKVGGMLCIDHMHIPQTEPVYSKRRWVVKVTCCCQQQTNAVEERLYHSFNDDREI
jgi:hypothetical protein